MAWQVAGALAGLDAVGKTVSAISQSMINDKAEDNLEKDLIANLTISNQNLHREQASAAVKGNAAAVSLPVNETRQKEHQMLRESGMQRHSLRAQTQAGFVNAALGSSIAAVGAYGEYSSEQFTKKQTSEMESRVSTLEVLAGSA